MTTPQSPAKVEVDQALPPHAGRLIACANDDHDGMRGWTAAQVHAYVAAERAEVDRLSAECEKLRAALKELLDAKAAKYPPFEDGVAAQEAWSMRCENAVDAGRAALATPTQGEPK